MTNSILLIGCTGFLGKCILYKLLKQTSFNMCIITSPRLPRRRRLKTAPNNLKITLDDVLLDQTNHDSSSSHSFETMSLDQTNHQSKTRMCFDPDEDAQEHSPQHQPSKKSVNFHERVIVRPILHVDDYTDEEWKKCWYLPTDKARRKDEIRAALRSIQEGKFGGCARGLEIGGSGESESFRPNPPMESTCNLRVI